MKSLLVLCLLVASAHADDLYGGVAMDTAPLAKARYEHAFGSIVMPVELSLPVIRPGGGDGELRAGARHTFALSERCRVDATLAGFARGTDNDAYRGGALGLDAEVVPAVAFGRALLGVELGVDQDLATYISNSAATRAVYMDVRDGWYRTTVTTVRAGVRAAYAIGGGELRLRAGMQNELVPFYAELGYAVHL